MFDSQLSIGVRLSARLCFGDIISQLPVSANRCNSIFCGFRFLSVEGIAECEKACKKDRIALNDCLRAALNVSGVTYMYSGDGLSLTL